MPCPEGTTIRYDMFMRTFPHPTTHVVKVDDLLTFCLRIDGTVITGTVNSIVNVTGTNQPLANGVDRITLGFLWGASRVIVEGFTFPDSSGNRRECMVKFTAVAPIGVVQSQNAQGTTQTALVLAAGPDPGESGTGTGNQT